MDLKKRIITDALSGEKVEVIVAPNRRLFHIEGFSREFIEKTRESYRNCPHSRLDYSKK